MSHTGGPSTASISCAKIPGGGPAGVYVDNAPYFYMDGITIDSCGGVQSAGIVISNADQATPSYATPGGVSANNNTVIANSVVINSKGNQKNNNFKIDVTSAFVPIVYLLPL